MMIPRCSHLIDSTGLRGMQAKSVTGGIFFGLVCLRVWGLFYHYEVHRGKGHIFKGNKCFWNFIIVTESFFSHAEIQR